MRGCRPCSSRRRLSKPGDLSLAHRGRGDHRSGGPALRRTSRLIPEASGVIMTADDDDAMLAALVRSLGSHSPGRREDVGDVAGRAAWAAAFRIRHDVARITRSVMPLRSTTYGADPADAAANIVAEAGAVTAAIATTVTTAATTAATTATAMPDIRAMVVAFVAVAAVTFRIRSAAAATTAAVVAAATAIVAAAAVAATVAATAAVAAIGAATAA